MSGGMGDVRSVDQTDRPATARFSQITRAAVWVKRTHRRQCIATALPFTTKAYLYCPRGRLLPNRTTTPPQTGHDQRHLDAPPCSPYHNHTTKA